MTKVCSNGHVIEENADVCARCGGLEAKEMVMENEEVETPSAPVEEVQPEAAPEVVEEEKVEEENEPVEEAKEEVPAEVAEAPVEENVEENVG